MAEAGSLTVSPSNLEHPTSDHPTVSLSHSSHQSLIQAVIPSNPDTGSEEKQEPGQDKSTMQYLGLTGTVPELHERRPGRRQGSISLGNDRSIFEVAYPKEQESERKSLPKKINDFCFRNLGLCSNTNHIQITVNEQIGGYGVWPSDFHSMCVKLAVYIGASEYILGPRLAWHYGGFIFYFVVIFLILISSFPANLLESLVGQYSAKSLVVFLPQLGPVFRGLGYAMLIITGLVLVYYVAHIANIAMYAYQAAQLSIPWQTCSPQFNSKHCFSEKLQKRCDKSSNYTVYHDFKCVPVSTYCLQNGFTGSNGTHCANHPNLTSRWMIDIDEQDYWNVTGSNVSAVGSVGLRYISTRDFHYHYVHGSYECKTNQSLPVCQNHARAFALAYCIVWLLALLPCFNLWVASTFAVVVLVASPMVILLVMTRVFVLPGAWTGVANFFFGRGNLRQLLTAGFWLDAIGMTFWSIAVGTGVIPTLSSRDPQRHDALRSSTILVTVDLAFGLLNSILLFSVRGHLELDAGFSKDQLRQLDHDTEALVFVAFTTITDGMPRPRFWGSIYFGTMAAQQLATMSMFIVAAALNLVDAVPPLRRRPFFWAVLVAASPFLLAAVALVANSLNDVRWSLFPLIRIQLAFVSLLFIVTVGVKLSTAEFREQVQLQMGMDVRGMWRWLVGSWLIASPLILLADILGQLVVYVPPPVPPGGVPLAVFGYIAAMCPLLALLGGALYAARTTPFRELCTTSSQFRVRSQQRRRRLSRRPSGHVRVCSRGGSVSVERGPSPSGSGSHRRSVTPEITVNMRWALAKRSTMLGVA